MSDMTGDGARRLFLDYFKKQSHSVVRSSSLVPQDDPTLLFTNAGMVQFKRIFLGEEKRNYTRAATSQKCVRAGGKHNDLENVGYTARHHTFFEMLGNFSFGDYFKEKAIEFAWDLLINGYKLPEEKLWISVYDKDDEAFDLWQKKIGVKKERIVRLGEADNFWSMGETGPCGPCSEILFDRGDAFGCDRPDCAVGCECDRYLEIWNLVFMQFNRDASGMLTPLPKPSIDTGMGLERILAVIQSTPTNYETDLILPIIQKVEELSGKALGELPTDDIAMKVVADHTRAAAFLIGDGVLPSNEGRGYVLRRIMRRAIRYGRNIGLTKPFLHETADVVFHLMKSAYPELSDSAAFITNVIKNEEIRFSETLDNGLKVLNDTLAQMKTKNQRVVAGDVIFKLYDTYGFPVDIVRDVVRDEKMTLDMDGFNAHMKNQRDQSRSTTSFTMVSEAYKKITAEGIFSEFSGYHQDSLDSNILVLVQDGEEVREAKAGSSVEIVTAATPFYAESGGQTGDQGKISGKKLEIHIHDTVKDPTGLIIHKGQVISGTVKKGDTVTLSVEKSKRRATARNHTATHLLHYALREVLGDHVKQAGSMVASERLRFDFSHFSQVESSDLDRIESIVNNRILENIPVQTDEMDAQEALSSGATALFEEKYGDRVRVISLEGFSRELCGGTHAERTGDIGLFKIISESSVASGVRRIEAVTGHAAVEYTQQISKIVQETARLVKDKPEELPQRVKKILSDMKSLEKEVNRLKLQAATKTTESLEEDIKQINGINVIVKKVPIDNPAALRDLADKYKDKIKSGVVVLGSINGSKVMLIAVVTKDLTDRYHAGNIIKQVAEIAGGSGGGRPDMAQAGGSKPEKLNAALDQAVELIANS